MSRFTRDMLLFYVSIIIIYSAVVTKGWAAQIIQNCDPKTGVCHEIIIPDNPQTQGDGGVWTR